MAKPPHSFGWTRDLPDHRDFLYSAPASTLTTLPAHVDLRPLMPPVYDQKSVGSCTGQAIAGAIQYNRRKLKLLPEFTPSALFIYYNEREMERTIPIDAGAQIRDGIKSVADLGVCHESDWPYIATPADPGTNLFPAGSPPVTRPSAYAYTEALNHQALCYYRVPQTLNQLKGCLAEGFPFIFGFSVYTNLYDVQGNPVINLDIPAYTDEPLGGHAILACGYSDDVSMFIIRNSWGATSQDNGYFYISYSYVTERNLANDFWTMRQMES